MGSCFQFRLGHQSYLFTFKKGFFLLSLFFVVLFCVLGVWQVHRYHYKKLLLSASHQLTAFSGHYENALTILLQNRFYKGQAGFEVVTPLRIPGQKKLLLVDRGWTPSSHIPSVPEEQHIKGYIKLLNEFQFILGKNTSNPTAIPLVMQKIDIDEISQITHQTYYPFVLRLDKNEANGFVREWVITTILPERHMGYAVQWFLMAIVLVIAYFCFCCERVKNDASK